MKTALTVFAALLFTTAALAQSNKQSHVDEAQIQRSLDSALAQLDSLDKDGKLADKITAAVDEAMKKTGGALAEAQKELKKAQDSGAIDSAMKQSADAMKEGKAAMKAAAKALKNSDALKHAGKAFEEAGKAFEQAMQNFEQEFEKELNQK